ncbi:MAG: CRISPR-associated protein Cas5t [Desulfonauticus sp.]|jgi:CRISPR-associated protein Cas5t|nr:MAG: CRISPR-associated protein DevS [Desulfonauticus sp. 38_4375]MDK2920446.1 CRISPR-associated protein Cas5t [Desulfonauticus sp.]
MLILYLQAPFATFRTFTAGSFRPTARFITPSAAYGLLLNIAGIEMRYDDGKSVMTKIDSGLPECSLALAALEFPGIHSLYQQIHNYPVGSSGKERKDMAKGSKYNIFPARRAFLSGIKAFIALKGNDELEEKVRKGLAGKTERKYGLPFLGDNNFLIDKLEIITEPKPAHWYIPLKEDDEVEYNEQIDRLTITIDRSEMSKTRSALFVPTKRPVKDIPPKAWVTVKY